MARQKSDATDGGAATPESDASAGTPEAAPGGEGPVEAESPPTSALEQPAVAEPDPAESYAVAPGTPAESEPTAMAPGPEVQEAEGEHEEHHDEHHEEEGPSLAARALGFLLILIAGAAIGIWGAPKVAPLLPAGLAPVAAWLTPAQHETDARVADLETRLDAGLGGMDSRLSGLATSGDVENRIAAAVAALQGTLSGEIGDLREAVGQVDGADTRQRLARLESTLDGQAAELATLKEQLTSAGAAAGSLSEETVAQIDVYRAELDGLRAELGTLSDKVQGLGARVDEVAAAADRQIATAQSQVSEIQASADSRLGRAELDADLAQVRAAVAAGLPFAEALDRVAAQPGVTVPEGLTAAAPTGVMTLAALRDSFPDAAHAAIRASILASAGEGLLSRTRAYLEAQVASRSLTPKQGGAPDAVLSRMEDRLRHDDLDGALAEADQLPSEAAAAMGGWLGAARLRAGAVAGLATLDGTVRTN